jgi:hypothetical protein
MFVHAELVLHYIQLGTSLPLPSKVDQGLSGIDQLLDEGHRLLAVLVDVLLVRVGVVAGAAIGVAGVAVRLDDTRAGRRALEASGAGGKLDTL